ncbi:DUF11 domain-containing protein [Yinghuangia sp. ASG 101]|uniref:DUF11 domain-containing protein n=1 Tax=Yinghuangia sp. ASG 101 TaxID=2896848 RepID=UPI001E37DFCD|nr:DUF11 domain-containing protein [Yinghuangia sp. ASG 101]UGQ10143.1 DUF11 domain-containing protein [Yinghuangia sp. ASG 101]
MPVRSPRRACLGTAAAVALVAVWPAAPASGSSLPPPTRPALAIKVDNGSMTSKPGQVHTYTVLLRNLGSTDLRDVTLTETLPSGVSLLDAGGGAVSAGADTQVTWTVALPTGQQLVHTVKARVDRLPDEHGVATTACARLGDSTVPVVCSTDVDRLPAEVADTAGPSTTTLLGGSVAALAAFGGAAWYVVRRRRAAAAAVAAD